MVNNKLHLFRAADVSIKVRNCRRRYLMTTRCCLVQLLVNRHWAIVHFRWLHLEEGEAQSALFKQDRCVLDDFSLEFIAVRLTCPRHCYRPDIGSPLVRFVLSDHATFFVIASL